MSQPDEHLFRTIIEDQARNLSDERITDAVTAHRAMRPTLERLRSVPLRFLEPVSEPATAITWIENGGTP